MMVSKSACYIEQTTTQTEDIMEYITKEDKVTLEMIDSNGITVKIQYPMAENAMWTDHLYHFNKFLVAMGYILPEKLLIMETIDGDPIN